MGNATSKAFSRNSKSINVDAGDWTTAYNRASNELSIQRKDTISRMGKREGDEGQPSSPKAAVQKDGNQIAAVNDFAIVKTLGKGAYGEVFLTRNKGDQFAIKVLKKSALKRMRQGRTGSALDSIKTEVATMKKIGHPNCVQMFDVILDPEQDEVRAEASACERTRRAR